MSVVTQKFIICDTDGCESNTVDCWVGGSVSVANMNNDAQKGGWLVVGRKHYCPVCVEKMKVEKL